MEFLKFQLITINFITIQLLKQKNIYPSEIDTYEFFITVG